MVMIIHHSKQKFYPFRWAFVVRGVFLKKTFWASTIAIHLEYRKTLKEQSETFSWLGRFLGLFAITVEGGPRK